MSRSISSAITTVLGGRAASILIGVIFTPIVVRLLGPSAFGRYATILAIFGLVNIVMSSGTNDSVRKYLSEDRPKDWKNAVFGFHVRTALVLAFSIAGLLLAMAHLGGVETTLGPKFVPLFVILSGFAVSRQAREILLRSLMGLKLERVSEPLKVSHFFLSRMGALLLVYLGLGVAGILLADMVASLVIAAISLALLSRQLDITSVLERGGPIQHGEMLRYAGGSILLFAFLTSLYQVDVLMLSWWTADSTVGHYKGALSIAERLWMLPLAMQSVMLQSTSEHWQKGNLNIINQLASRLTRFVTLITLLMAIGLAVLADSFIPLYLGAEFKAAVTPLRYLLPGVVGFALARPVLAISQSKGNIRPVILATAASAIINISINAALIPRFGMTGAAIATSVGYGSLPLFQGLVARHFNYRPFTGSRTHRILLAAVPTAVVIYGLDYAITSDITSLLVIPVVGFVVYLLCAWASNAIDSADIHRAADHIPHNWLTVLRHDDESEVDAPR